LEKDKAELLKKIRLGRVPESELTEIYYEYRGNHLFLFNLIQNPLFPIRLGQEIIPELYPVELIRVIANKRTNPFIRKRCETEFFERYKKIALGEKISLMKFAPLSVLLYLVEERDKKILKTIVSNPKCTEELIVKLINRKGDRTDLYSILLETDWLKQKNVSIAVSYDKEAPIKAWIKIIPFLPLKRLKEMSDNKNIHTIVKKNIKIRLNK